jgi:hypothetical protein
MHQDPVPVEEKKARIEYEKKKGRIAAALP